MRKKITKEKAACTKSKRGGPDKTMTELGGHRDQTKAPITGKCEAKNNVTLVRGGAAGASPGISETKGVVQGGGESWGCGGGGVWAG